MDSYYSLMEQICSRLAEERHQERRVAMCSGRGLQLAQASRQSNKKGGQQQSKQSRCGRAGSACVFCLLGGMLCCGLLCCELAATKTAAATSGVAHIVHAAVPSELTNVHAEHAVAVAVFPLSAFLTAGAELRGCPSQNRTKITGSLDTALCCFGSDHTGDAADFRLAAIVCKPPRKSAVGVWQGVDGLPSFFGAVGARVPTAEPVPNMF